MNVVLRTNIRRCCRGSHDCCFQSAHGADDQYSYRADSERDRWFTPQQAKDRLREATERALKDPDVIASMRQGGFEPGSLSVPEIDAFIRENVLRKAGVQLGESFHHAGIAAPGLALHAGTGADEVQMHALQQAPLFGAEAQRVALGIQRIHTAEQARMHIDGIAMGRQRRGHRLGGRDGRRSSPQGGDGAALRGRSQT